MIIWLNGSLIEASAARIDPSDRGFTLGDGLFETIAVRYGHILRLDAHIQRLKQGCVLLNLPFPATDIGAALEATRTANALQNAAMRLTLTRGAAPRGLRAPQDTHTTLLMSAAPMPDSPPPARCIIAMVTRRNEHSPLSRIKSLNYLDNILARQEAIARDADEAIMLNTNGLVADASSSNIFIVKNGHVVTPAVTDGAMPGVMRAAVLEACNGVQRSLTTSDLLAADGVFLTNSLGVWPVTTIDGKLTHKDERGFIENLKVKLAAA